MITFDDYQKFCARGVLGPTTKIGKAIEEVSEQNEGGESVVYSLGLIGEVGEVVDIIKKHFGHGKPLDKEHLTEELGDVLWYVAQISSSFNLDLSSVINYNIIKLKERYKDAYN